MAEQETRAIKVGWFAFDGGFGRPYEGWYAHRDRPGWRCVGRALTRAGAKRKARRALNAAPLIRSEVTEGGGVRVWREPAPETEEPHHG